MSSSPQATTALPLHEVECFTSTILDGLARTLGCSVDNFNGGAGLDRLEATVKLLLLWEALSCDDAARQSLLNVARALVNAQAAQARP